MRHWPPAIAILSALAVGDARPAAAQPTAGAAPAAGPCTGSKFREFDFWIGRWTVLRPDGQPAGTNLITSEEGGCAIVEQWTSANGGTGQSLNFYDPAAGSWRQVWVGLGLVLMMDGGLVDGAMVLEGRLQYLGTGRVTRLRGVWTPLPDGRVRQQFHESDDGGRTWKPWFDGYYSRTGAAT
jgi:hypothetical protein